MATVKTRKTAAAGTEGSARPSLEEPASPSPAAVTPAPTPEAAPPAEVPAISFSVKYQTAPEQPEALPLAYPRVAVTREQLTQCIESHERELVHQIANPTMGPSDGYIPNIVRALEILSQIIPTKETPA